ncbi:MAG: hydantoinase/oxoprolinase family protein [Planctomycetota bacterium]
MPPPPESNGDWFAPPGTRPWLGLDVGGANLKAADGRGHAVSRPFPLWKQPERLAEALNDLVTAADTKGDAAIALTMTGELADCYATKSEGVRAIVQAARSVAASRPVRVATVDDCWLTVDGALDSPLDAAAANWRLGARLVARVMRDAVWIDVGSTTTDVIAVTNGAVASDARTDTDRLLSGELVYTGVGRTPVCAVVRSLPYRGERCPVMAEWFATTGDAWLLLGAIDEDATDTDTADGRPRTEACARHRLARCLGADEDSFTRNDALAAARAVVDSQVEMVTQAFATKPGETQRTIVVTGSGASLGIAAAEAVHRGPPIALSEVLGVAASAAFPAHAAAVLAEREGAA